MLHESVASSALLSVLRWDQIDPPSKGFALAGGTSLALRMGHRISTDLDFFTIHDFDPSQLAEDWNLGPNHILAISKGTLRLILSGVKVEFIRHGYPLIAPIENLEGIQMWSIPDVSAMKMNAITNRGSKKDFFDIDALLDRFELPQILNFYKIKYQPSSLLMAVRSLIWFEDADTEPDPISLNERTWGQVKQRLRKAIQTLD